MPQYYKDITNTNITDILVRLLDENIIGFRDIVWRSKSKRFNTLDAKTIKYELCVLISDAYYGHELKHREDSRYYSLGYQRIKDRLGKEYRKYLDIAFDVKGGVKLSSWNRKDGSTLKWKLKKNIIELCDKAYRTNKDIRKLVGKDGKILTEWQELAVSEYNEKSEFSTKVSQKPFGAISSTIKLNKINSTIATHLFSDLYKWKTGRLKLNAVTKWKKIVENLGGDINDDLRFGKDRLQELHLRSIELWNQLNIDIIGVGYIAQVYKRRNTGRLYGTGHKNIQNTQRELRRLLLAGNGYYDYDMENAHYTILEQYYTMLTNKKLNRIKHYVKNTEAIRVQLVQETGIKRSIIKKSLLAIVYGAKIESSEKVVFGVHTETEIYKDIFNITKNKDIADDMFDKFSTNQIIIDIWTEVDIAYKVIKKSWRTRYTKPKTRIRNMYGLETNMYEKAPNGEWWPKSKGKLLSHFLQGIEAKILLEIISVEGNSFVLALHDGWVSKIDWETKDLEEIISKSTRLVLLEYNNIRASFNIKIKKDELSEVVDGGWTEKLLEKGVVQYIG